MIGWADHIPVALRSPELKTVTKRARGSVNRECTKPVFDTGGQCLRSWRNTNLQALQRLCQFAYCDVGQRENMGGRANAEFTRRGNDDLAHNDRVEMEVLQQPRGFVDRVRRQLGTLGQ